MRVIFFLLLLFFTCPLIAQFKLKGTVVDAITNKPLPFVNIVFNNNNYLGTTTDIDGQFEFENKEPVSYLVLSYIGYLSDSIYLGVRGQKMIFRMQKTEITTPEIVVVAGENPAYRIIRKVIGNRKKHDPENIPSYSYSSYNKITVFDEYNAPVAVDSIKKEERLDFFYSLMETISEVKYIAPNKREEHILATKMSGFKNPTFMTVVAEIQPISFHKENFLITDKEFLSPISSNAIAKYEYSIEDTLFQEKDTVFIISFLPRKHTNFDALKGSLYINTNGYALQNLIVEPAEKQKIHLRIHQKYTLIKNKVWFPQQLNFELELQPRKKSNYTLQGKRYISNVNLNPQINVDNFGINKSTMAENATRKDSSYWKQNRLIALSSKEENTYKVINELAKKIPLDMIMNTFSEFSEERLAIGLIALDHTKLMEVNLHEKFRIGLGLYTSNVWSKYVTFGGYFAYGFKDKKWKWGTSLQIRPFPNKGFAFEMSYIDDITEPAAIIQKQHPLSKKVLPKQSFTRRNVLDQMDKTYEFEMSTLFRSFQYLQTRFFANWSYKTPLYDYRFGVGEQYRTKFKIARLGVQLRYSYKEDYTQLGAFNIKIRSRFPIFYLSYTRGIAGVLGGEYDFHKIMAGVETTFFVKGWGRTVALLQGGCVVGKELPYPLLFNGRGSFNRYRMFLVKQTFQTMRPNEFVVDKFVYLFVEHNFGSLLFQANKFKPEIRIYQSVGFGWLSEQDRHEGIRIQDMHKGYFESGLMLSNLVRFDMFNFGDFGLGAGVFVRYGAYYLPNNIWDNIAIKLNMGVSF